MGSLTPFCTWAILPDISLCGVALFKQIKSDNQMNPKPRPNHRRYIETLRNMSPEKRLLKAFERSAFTKQLFIQGLRKRFPDLSQEEFQKILLQRLDKCHNKNY
ncbi:MAG: hypothetical protein ACI8V2_002244 [Candidatus Latescibacterota bacterium]